MTQTALITGGAIRVGKMLSLSLAEQGYDIALHYNSSKQEAEETANAIRALGRECTLYQANLLDSNEVASLIPTVSQNHPTLSVLVNSASFFDRLSFLDTSEQDFDRIMELNVKVPFFLSQAFAKTYKQGNIINILASDATGNTSPRFAYALSKKSLTDFTQMAALKLGPNLRVNALCLGLIIPTNDQEADYAERIQNSIPMQRLANQEDIAKGLDTLLTNPILTGQILYLDGGESLNK